MRLVQAHRKLATNDLLGYSLATKEFVNTENPSLLEVSGHWVSERVSFNARRVLIVERVISQRVVRLGVDTLNHILYSEQKNIRRNQVIYYDYTILDQTDEAKTVTITTVPSASGMGGVKTETLSDPFPVHMVRYAATSSEEAEHVKMSRMYAFAPGNLTITEDQELVIGGDRFVITESVKELLCVRLSLVRR